MKRIRLVILLVLTLMFNNAIAQSLVLRPGLGKRFFTNASIDKSLPYNIHTTKGSVYSNNQKTHKFNSTANIAVELLYPKHSWELVFTSQISGFNFTIESDSTKVDVREYFESSGGIRQFQLYYNAFTNNIRRKSNGWNYKFFGGIGIGIGIARTKKNYELAQYISYFESATNPGQYLKFVVDYKKLHPFSYSIPIKAGIIITKKNIERLRLQIGYNWGLNFYQQEDVNYSITNDKYNFSFREKGRQLSLLVSVPIYLKRFKKKSE